MNPLLSHGLAAMAGAGIQFGIGRLLRSAVLRQARARQGTAAERVSSPLRHRIATLLVPCLSVLALLGIATTAVVIDHYQRAGRCEREAVLAAARETSSMLDTLLAPSASNADRLAGVQRWRRAQDDTQRRIRGCG